MKWVHQVRARVFVHPEQDEEEVTRALLSLFPFSLEKEKIPLQQTIARGFENKRISILTVVLDKNRHCNAFLKHLLETISPEQKKMLVEQKDRLDDGLRFFIRIDLETFLQQDKIRITESGDCIHLTLNIAAFPANKGRGREVVEKLFRTQAL